MSNDDPQLFSIHNLLSLGDNYVIPIYQRNYAWGEGEIDQLIQDVIDYCLLKETRNYYIGTLVVAEKTVRGRSFYETIDGQQRLTTLSLLASCLKNENINGQICDVLQYEKLVIDFESRKHSRQTMVGIFNGKFTDNSTGVLDPISEGYRLIKKILPQKLTEYKVELQQFSNFLFNSVQIMRVKVPKDTDLNHYFEIMNSRGEQLEKHEILKSKMMEVLDGDKESQNCLHMVWEACSNMEKYVQVGFSEKQRNAIFGDEGWSSFVIDDFEALRDKIGQSDNGPPYSTSEQTLDEIIGKAKENNEHSGDKNREDPERFSSVINFSNFLLQVLLVQTESENVPLDDKRLISTFESKVLNGKGDDAAEKVKKFTFNLLRCKLLYDQYIIKREFGTDRWSLQRLRNDNGSISYKNTFGDEDVNDTKNRKILMLLSAFHVSSPTLSYKYWLTAALRYLFTVNDNSNIVANEYLNHLESVAKSFVFDRFLSVNDGLDYFDIIFQNKGVYHTRKEALSDEHMENKLSFGNIGNNLVFNFLDYLLWVKHQASDNKVKSFEFTFRSSVEHYYPQNPPNGKRLDQEVLDSFGNLCLISHSKNSQLSNHMPVEKREHYENSKIDSVKQYFMMKYERWDEASIKEHFEEMKSILLYTLESTERPELSLEVNDACFARKNGVTQ